MFKRILVPVDGSSTSEQALQRAVELAREQGARLRLVHVVDEINLNMEGAYLTDEFAEAVRQAGCELLAKAEASVRAGGIEPESCLLELERLGTHVAEIVVAEAARWPADLIVIGTHGRRGVSHLLLGSVAERLVRSAATPVLLLRGG